MFEMFSGSNLYVDICGNVLKYMQAKYDKTNNTAHIKKYGTITLSSFNNEITSVFNESSETAGVIKTLVRKERISAKKVFISISDKSIISRLVEVPSMSVRDLSDYLKMEITQYLPINAESFYFDYKVIEEVEKEGKQMLSLLLTAVPKIIIDSYASMFRNAGLKPIVIDVYPNVISRLFGALDKGNVLTVELNQKMIYIVILENGKLFMYLNFLLDEGLEINSNNNGDAELYSESDIERITGHIKNYIDFFAARHHGMNLDTVFVLGELSKAKNIDKYIFNALNVKVKLGLPDELTLALKSHINVANANCRLSEYAPNMGLMLRGGLR